MHALILLMTIVSVIERYRWIKNGKHFDWQAYDDRISQQPGRGSLVISSPRDEDLGNENMQKHLLGADIMKLETDYYRTIVDLKHFTVFLNLLIMIF
jgi:hypothetical protein